MLITHARMVIAVKELETLIAGNSFRANDNKIIEILNSYGGITDDPSSLDSNNPFVTLCKNNLVSRNSNGDIYDNYFARNIDYHLNGSKLFEKAEWVDSLVFGFSYLRFH